MTKEIPVKSSVDDSTKLQKLINSSGSASAKYIFQGDELEINSLIRFFNYTECSGNGITFRLMENAPTNPFSEQVPLVGSKYTNGTEGLNFHNIIFEGNRDIQNKVPKRMERIGVLDIIILSGLAAFQVFHFRMLLIVNFII